MAVEWMKAKYSSDKRAGRFTSTHNDDRRKSKKAHWGRTTVEYDKNAHVMVVDGGTGATTWRHTNG